jgi:hypothetical protein
MKKILFGLAILTLAIASCKKDSVYTNGDTGKRVEFTIVDYVTHSPIPDVSVTSTVYFKSIFDTSPTYHDVGTATNAIGYVKFDPGVKSIRLWKDGYFLRELPGSTPSGTQEMFRVADINLTLNKTSNDLTALKSLVVNVTAAEDLRKYFPGNLFVRYELTDLTIVDPLILTAAAEIPCIVEVIIKREGKPDQNFRIPVTPSSSGPVFISHDYD